MVFVRTRKPRILVTGPDHGGFIAWAFTRLAVRRAGGRPIRIHPSRHGHIPHFDALIIGGGADVDPALYGGVTLEQLREATRDSSQHSRTAALFWGLIIFFSRKLFSLGHRAGVDQARDTLERQLLRQALDQSLPILGICRGAQLLNVLRGGDLHQSITPFYTETPKADTVLPRKTVLLEPDSHLALILGPGEARVNSLHNQAIRQPGEGVRPVARERNGIIQAIELRDYPFALGLQWHPEYLPQSRRQQRLFRALVQAAHTTTSKPDL